MDEYRSERILTGFPPQTQSGEYLKEIGSISLLTPEEETDLLRRKSEGMQRPAEAGRGQPASCGKHCKAVYGRGWDSWTWSREGNLGLMKEQWKSLIIPRDTVSQHLRNLVGETVHYQVPGRPVQDHTASGPYGGGGESKSGGPAQPVQSGWGGNPPRKRWQKK